LKLTPVFPQHLLVAGQFVGWAGIGQGTTCFQVWQQHFLLRVEHLGGFGHEMHAAEDDDGGCHLRGFPGQFQGIARDVREFLNLAFLVIVGEDRRPDLLFQPVDVGDDIAGNRRCNHVHFPCFLSVA
jgi:hypothetical protein